MTKRFLTAVAALIFVASASLLAKETAFPDGTVKDPVKTATDFLKGKGVDDPALEVRHSTERLSVFSDSRSKCFIVVADEGYASRIGSAILAYSTESALNGGSDEMLYRIFAGYDEMLSKLKPGRLCLKARLFKKKTDSGKYTAPMVPDFGQGEPYNKYFPSTPGAAHASVGCGPLALAQVVWFHKHGGWPKGSGSITDANGKVTKYKLDSYALRFSGDENDSATLMLCCAASLNAKALNAKDTQTAFNDMKGALVSRWGFSPACTHVKNADDATLIELAETELSEGRPLLVARTGEHTFVADGLDGAYIHLNFGWYGYCNGWFRMMNPVSGMHTMPFSEMMTGIEPFRDDAARGISVSVKAPGTLESLLSEQQIKTLSSIKITGPIDGADIAVLRRMAGAKAEGKEGHGVLTDMDLGDAVIVGNTPYHTRPCFNMGVSGYYSDGTTYSYDMSRITDAEWARFTSENKQKNSSRLITRGSDGVYYITFYSENGVLGKYMFEDCENLLSVTLPAGISEMRSYVFLNCRALKTVKNLPQNRDANAMKGSGMEK